MGLNAKEKMYSGFVNTKGANKPAPPLSLIRAFIIRLLESIVSQLAVSDNYIFLLVFVAEQAGLCITLSLILKTGFLARGLIRKYHAFENTKPT